MNLLALEPSGVPFCSSKELGFQKAVFFLVLNTNMFCIQTQALIKYSFGALVSKYTSVGQNSYQHIKIALLTLFI